MKKLNTKFWMIRPSDGFLPLAWMVCSALGRSDMADRVFHFLLLTRLFGLASAAGLRQAFARQPSMRRARGSVLTALLLQLGGATLVTGLELLANRGRIAPTSLVCIGAGLLLNIEHVFYEYLFAVGEKPSAAMARAVTAALTLGGVLMTAEGSAAGRLPYASEWVLGAAALSAAVSAVVGVAVGGRLRGRLNGEVIACAPSAILQTLVYPLAAMLATLIPHGPAARTSAPFFAGLALYELWRTPFRRSALESRPMFRALAVAAAVSAVALAVTLRLPLKGLAADLPAAAVMLLVAAGCAAGMYGHFSRRED